MSQTYQHNERPGPMRNPAFHVPQEEKWLCGHGDAPASMPSPPEQGKLAAHAVLVEEVGKQVVLARPGDHRGDGDGRLLVAPAKLCTLVSGTDRVMGRLFMGSMTTPRP